ncbi:galactokinase [Sediminispirochaeta smaragdinae]|jgi:galactokinase|uniref:Galactokinase n=1 Tax=Sediminispirochaeta smaragdinae (strain DSM 11293 / JCM 15392 / SEBR 4228) TaxID=573413 RepID=E1R5E5_SEDSS|nr:galactokinase [Sediminispirochaeta smaragdinae]ADK82273.1 galactokinase [Sediminispirochaeta smaragdinae DSM 11293]
MKDLIARHVAEYGSEPEVMASAPGVLNLMGEHTDFAEGYVLQAALPHTVEVAISRRKDNSLRFYAADVHERKRTTVANLKYKREDRWANYLKGVLYELLQLGYQFRGLNISFGGTVPQGIGLGSSAAVGLATACAMRELFGYNIEDIKLVQVVYLSESAFIGLPEQITDQFVSCFAKQESAVFLNLHTLEYNHLPLRIGNARFVVTNSNVNQNYAKEEVSERYRQCEEGIEKLQGHDSGKMILDFSEQELKQGTDLLSEAERRLCLHVVGENRRVIESRSALLQQDLVSFGKIMNRSQESLRDNFEVSCPEIDWLVKRAGELEGCYGSRLVGPGFGGCTVTLLEEAVIEEYQRRLEDYERIFGFHPDIFVCEPSSGAKIIFSKRG